MSYDHSADTRSIYIHWPFCPYRCHFCPFVALASHDHFMARYHHTLMKEVDLFLQMIEPDAPLESVFFGGGTPSTYPSPLLLDMSDKLKGKFDITVDTEVTIEVNPGTVEKKQLLFWKELGINRISIGVQSLNDSVLKKLNRLHKAQDVKRLIGWSEGVFGNISVDLILGLPGVTQAEWKQLVQEVVTWPLQHVSIYFLTVHEDTRLFFDLQRKKIALPTDDVFIDLYHWSVIFLEENGFERYETSNFARSGYQCKHNNVYWDRRPYKGFGLGACSFDGKSRFQNKKNLMSYLEGGKNGAAFVESSEMLTEDQVRMEKIMLGLRRSSGVSVRELFDDVAEEKKRVLKQEIERFKAAGYLEERFGKLLLTPQAFVVQNEIAVKLSV